MCRELDTKYLGITFYRVRVAQSAKITDKQNNKNEELFYLSECCVKVAGKQSCSSEGVTVRHLVVTQEYRTSRKLR